MTIKKRQRVILTKNQHELRAWAAQGVVCGIDEVGRGCLAGPLVTAAVILPVNKTSPLIKDSKVLTEEQRYKAARWINNKAWVGYGIVDHRLIDSLNIWHATHSAMKRALVNLLAICPLKPQAVLVDAIPLKLSDTTSLNIPVHYFPKGEKYSSSIAAASIMAKIKRDELMTKLNSLFPGYGLEHHKGYCTAAHQEAIKTYDYAIIHRKTFLKSFMAEPQEQQSLFESVETIPIPNLEDEYHE